MSSKENCRQELRLAIQQLSERCLYSASKWAAEQLVGIEHDPAKYTPSLTSFQRGSSSIRRRFRTDVAGSGEGASGYSSTPIAGVSYLSTPVLEDDNNVVESDFCLLAKSYFDCREFRRAAHVLRDQTSKKAVFLRCYALYLAGEKRKDEEMIELEGPLGKSDTVNGELVSLERELAALRETGTMDSFCLYLYGLVLKEKGNESLARIVLVESVNIYPWNWSAWSELQSLCSTVGILNSLHLSKHRMKDTVGALSSAQPESTPLRRSASIFRRSQSTRKPHSSSHPPTQEPTQGRTSFSFDPSFGYPPVPPQAYVAIETEACMQREFIRRHLLHQHRREEIMWRHFGLPEEDFQGYCITEDAFRIDYQGYPFDTVFEQFGGMNMGTEEEEDDADDVEIMFRRSQSTREPPSSSHPPTQEPTQGRTSFSFDPSFGYPPVPPQAYVAIETEACMQRELIRRHLLHQHRREEIMWRHFGLPEEDFQGYCISEDPFRIDYQGYPFDTFFEQFGGMNMGTEEEEDDADDVEIMFRRSQSTRKPPSSHPPTQEPTQGRTSFSFDPSFGYPPVPPQAYVAIETEACMQRELIRRHLLHQHRREGIMWRHFGLPEEDFQGYCISEDPFRIDYQGYPFDTVFEQFGGMNMGTEEEEDDADDVEIVEPLATVASGQTSYDASQQPVFPVQEDGNSHMQE